MSITPRVLLGLATFLLMTLAAPAMAAEKSPYMGGPAETMTLPNGAVANKEMLTLMSKTVPQEPKTVKVTDGIWSLEGYAFVNCTIIEGKTGLIVYDTGDDVGDGKKFLQAIRKFSKKPIKAIIYSHSHYPFGSTAMAEGRKDVMVIGHLDINKNIMESGGLGADVPELAPMLTGRTLEQFSVYLPKKGPDAAAGKSPVGTDEKGFLPVTRPVKQGEVLTVDGVKMQFFTDYDSDTDDCLMVWLPEKKVCIQNLYWPMFPNLYTLRGSKYRDPLHWLAGLHKIRDLAPEHLISTHTHYVNGKDLVFKAVTNYQDAMAFVYDQTLRRILKGETPQELRHTVKLPKHLAQWPNNQMTYGELSYYPPNIYYYALGWFNGHTATLNPVSPDIEAKKIVEGFGGKDKVMAAVKKAMQNKEYAWATQLVDYLFRIMPQDKAVRQLKADTLRKMGQLTMAIIPRSWYLTQALALEGKIKVANLVMPKAEEVMRSRPGTYVSQYRIRIDPGKSAQADKMLVISFSDVKKDADFGLHVRGGVAEFVTNLKSHYKKPDATLEMPRKLWAQYFIGELPLDKLLASPGVKVSDAGQAKDFLAMFDQYDASVPNMKLTLAP